MFTKEEYFWELSLYGTAEMLIFEYGTGTEQVLKQGTVPGYLRS